MLRAELSICWVWWGLARYTPCIREANKKQLKYPSYLFPPLPYFLSIVVNAASLFICHGRDLEGTRETGKELSLSGQQK